jgi:hypothetical protein
MHGASKFLAGYRFGLLCLNERFQLYRKKFFGTFFESFKAMLAAEEICFSLKGRGKKGIRFFGTHTADRIGKDFPLGMMMEMFFVLALMFRACHLIRLLLMKIYAVSALITDNN